MKKLSIFVTAVLAMALLVPAAFAQMGTVKGTVKDETGKPIQGAVVTLTNKETGRHYELKTDKNGRYFSIGITGGTSYDFVVTNNGQLIDKVNGFPVKIGEENTLDFDLAKDRAAAQANMSEAQKQQAAEAQKIQKENEKIKGLNQMLADAKTAGDAGNWDQAVQILTQATQADPNRDLLWFKLGDAQRMAASKAADPAAKKSGYEGAVESYKKAVSLAGNTKPDMLGAAYNNLGEAYVKNGDVEDAIKSYDAAAAADPTKAGQYYFNEGAVLTNSGKSDEAVIALDKAIQADPNRADAYYWKGVNLMAHAKINGNKMEAPAGTAEAFNKYLELQPDGPMAQPAKDMLATMGAAVETSFGKGKTKKK